MRARTSARTSVNTLSLFMCEHSVRARSADPHARTRQCECTLTGKVFVRSRTHLTCLRGPTIQSTSLNLVVSLSNSNLTPLLLKYVPNAARFRCARNVKAARGSDLNRTTRGIETSRDLTSKKNRSISTWRTDVCSSQFAPS